LTQPKRSPLYQEHINLGAKLVDFGGWEMPLNYPGGTIAEHMACRRDAVAFDVSHLGTVRIGDPDGFARLQRTFTNDLGKIAPGRAQYTHLLDESASVVDDIIVWWVDNETFDVMPNASNTAPVTNAIGGVDVTAERAIIAVQGPQARHKLASVFAEASSVPRFEIRQLTWNGVPVTVAGTGYTGEDGVELSIPSQSASAMWQAIVDAGITPAGLGARDTLRLEAGLPLHGHELGPGITPLQAGLSWVVAWNKGEFVGRSALLEEKQRGITRRLRGLRCVTRQPPRSGNFVFVEGEQVGTVSSGNFSPVLQTGIAMAFVEPSLLNDTSVEVETRGHRLEACVTAMPFVTKAK
jgi:aminomethyltransferase